MEETFVDDLDIDEDVKEAPGPESVSRIATGRVFFKKDGDRFEKGKNLTEIIVVPLENHVTNVRKLAENRVISKPLSEDEAKARRSKLIRAAEIHDQGKAWRLSLYYNEKSDEFVYSYAGHRFDVTDLDPYVQELVTLHHSFSVYEIARAVHRIRNAKMEVALPFDRERIGKIFQEDLYALEMCDQVVAEVETGCTPGKMATLLSYCSRASCVATFFWLLRHPGQKLTRCAAMRYKFRLV